MHSLRQWVGQMDQPNIPIPLVLKIHPICYRTTQYCQEPVIMEKSSLFSLTLRLNTESCQVYILENPLSHEANYFWVLPVIYAFKMSHSLIVTEATYKE